MKDYLVDHALTAAVLGRVLGIELRGDDADAVWRMLRQQEPELSRRLLEAYHDEIRQALR